MEQKEIEVVGKVFVVVGGKRQCLVCDGLFTRQGAAVHATSLCHPYDAEGSSLQTPTDSRELIA